MHIRAPLRPEFCDWLLQHQEMSRCRDPVRVELLLLEVENSRWRRVGPRSMRPRSLRFACRFLVGGLGRMPTRSSDLQPLRWDSFSRCQLQ